MVKRYIRIGSIIKAQIYDDAALTSGIEVDAPIKADTPVEDEHVLRKADVGTLVGDVIGPAISTDNAIVRFHLATGKVIQDSALLLDDNGDLSKAVADLKIDCGAAKTVELVQTVWDDLRITPGSFDRLGISDPSIVAYDVNGGGISTFLYQFAKNDIASFVVQLPHGYKQGTDISVHAHWTPGPNGVAESGKTVGWKVDISWANVDETFPSMATADLSDACDGTNHKHQKTPAVVIDGHTVAKNISSMLLCNIKRTDTGADDTWTGTGAGNLPLILEVDFHYQIDTLGSRQTTVK